MENKNNWNKISNDVSNTLNKIKENFEQNDSVEDLKDSFYSTIENSVNLVKSLSDGVEKTITDEEIKFEVKETLSNINSELIRIKKEILNSLYREQNLQNSSEEE